MARLDPTPTTIYKLLALSGGVCAMPECGKSLVQEGVFNATLAHITAASPKGPRFDPNIDDEARRDFSNLMFMCPDHGSLVDKKKLGEKYTTEWLRKAKDEHEQKHATSQYSVTGEILADALEEIYVSMEQTNTINGDGNTQTNNQIYIHSGNLTDAAAETIDRVTGGEKSTDDNDKPGPPSTPSAPTTVNEVMVDDISNQPGVIDSIATLETGIPVWTQTMTELSTEITIIGKFADNYSNILQEQNRRGLPMSAKIPVFKDLATDLLSPAKKIENLSLQYIEQVNIINPGMHALIELNTNNASSGDPESVEKAYTLFNSIDGMTLANEEALTSLEEMLTSMRPLETMSKDLRTPLKRIRDGLTFMLQSRPIVQEWSELAKKCRHQISENASSS